MSHRRALPGRGRRLAGHGARAAYRDLRRRPELSAAAAVKPISRDGNGTELVPGVPGVCTGAPTRPRAPVDARKRARNARSVVSLFRVSRG